MKDLDWQQFVTEPESGIIEFTMKPEHVALLRHARVQWNTEYHGAPQINPNRPYGNRAFYSGMADVLGLETYDYQELMTLHQETAVALQVILKTGKFKAGKYRADKFSQNWVEYRPKKIKEPCDTKTLFDTDSTGVENS